MFTQHQLIQLEYALKYVLQDLQYDINAAKDGDWYRELCGLLATVQAEQQHEAG